MSVEIIVSEEEESDFTDFVHSRIKRFNDAHSHHHREARKPRSSKPLNVIVKDSSGDLIGGLAATTYWDWLDIEDLYLPEDLRGQGLGGSILKTAETMAAGRGCVRAFLSTFEFQARSFYEEQGFRVVGTLEDYPPGSSYYWMRKELDACPTGAAH